MTKAIRIENADTSDYKVVVETWEKQPGDLPDKLVGTKELSHPTQLETFTLWAGRYFVVKEAPRAQ